MSSPPLSQAPFSARLNLGLLGLLVAALSLLLWPHWRHNPDLSHAYFMPVLFLLLLHEGRTRGTPRYLPPHWLRTGLLLGALFGACAGLVAAGLYATAVGWTHTVVCFTLTGAVVLVLGAGLVALSADEVRVVPFNWNTLVALGLWLLCAPLPPGTYSRLTLGLQLSVSEHVLTALHLLGVAASRNGNIIELARTSVGVAEACSGVRSLISCIFAGFFFSATLVRRPWARTLLVLLAAPLALVMNFLRSLILTLAANRGVDISGTWHDLTGFAVLGVTTVILGGLALLLERPAGAIGPPPAPPAPAGRILPLQIGLTAGLITVAALGVFFVLNTRTTVRTDTLAPDLFALLPTQAEGWKVETSRNLYQFSATLETEYLAQRTYYRRTTAGDLLVTVYLAYWRAGQTPVSQVVSHTPDACWPGAGWQAARMDATRQSLAVGRRTLAPAEARLFRNGDFPQYVWFWHIFGGRPIAYVDPYSWNELLRIAWRYGFRHDGDQLFVRFSSNQPWPALQDEPLVRDIFNRLQPLGL